jgi:hypothetical protein
MVDALADCSALASLRDSSIFWRKLSTAVSWFGWKRKKTGGPNLPCPNIVEENGAMETKQKKYRVHSPSTLRNL